jgi:hypothetical protein
MVILAMRTFSNVSSGVANISIYRPSVDPLQLAADRGFHPRCWRGGGVRPGTPRGSYEPAHRPATAIGSIPGPSVDGAKRDLHGRSGLIGCEPDDALVGGEAVPGDPQALVARRQEAAW